MPTVSATRLPRAAAALAIATVLVGAGAGAAHAARTPAPATGTTTVQIGGPVLKNLSRNGCGPLTASALGDATVRGTGAGKFQATFAITRIVYTDTGSSRVEHGASGVRLVNDCYDVTFSGLYVQDLGSGPDERGALLDVLARTRSSDETGQPRLQVFQLDASGSRMTSTTKAGTTITRTMGLDLLLGDEGAREFNQLATGSEDSGPFTAGQQVGKARTTIRVPQSAVVVSSDDSTPPPSDS